MKQTLALTNISGQIPDIAFDENGQVTFVTSHDYVRQRLQTRLNFFFGEWVFDTSLGLPWLEQVFVKPANIVVTESLIKDTILNTPHVTELESYTDVFDAENRTYSVNFSVFDDFSTDTTQQQTFSINPFKFTKFKINEVSK